MEGRLPEIMGLVVLNLKHHLRKQQSKNDDAFVTSFKNQNQESIKQDKKVIKNEEKESQVGNTTQNSKLKSKKS